MSMEIRELNVFELDLASGGMDYKFCWNGPAGTGTYPSYIDCGGGGSSGGSTTGWGTDESAIWKQLSRGPRPPCPA
jgi:hypothetical protein